MSKPPRPTAKVAKKIDDEIKNSSTHRKGTGRPKGIAKPPGSGRKPGTPNKLPGPKPSPEKTRDSAVVKLASAKVRGEMTMLDAVEAVFGALTDDELDKITPVKVMRLCTIIGIKGRSFGLALLAAEKWAPYVHAKLAAKELNDDDEDGAIEIRGGLVDPNKIEK